MIKEVYYKDKTFHVQFLSGIKKYKGLMFSRKLKNNQGIMLVNNHEAILSIHMLFVFFPIKIVWINSNKEIVDIKTAYPFQLLISSIKKARYILELNNNSNLNLGDKLKF